jgi:hydrogenase maturation protease
MADLREQLEQIFQGRVCLLGVGNVDFGDDGFGVRLAEELGDSEAASPQKPAHGSSVRSGMSIARLRLKVINAGTTPERFIGRLAAEGFEHVIFLDAVELGGAAGSVVFLNSDEMAGRFPQISTHKISLGLLARQVEANGQTKVWLLGVQPESLRAGQELTPRVRAALELLRELLRDVAQVGRESPRRTEDCAPYLTGSALEVMA